MERISVFVYARDPISEAGVAAQLRSRAEMFVVDEGGVDTAQVAVVLADDLDEEAARVIRAIQRNGCPRVVAVISHLDDLSLMRAVEAGACGILRRADATPEGLAGAVRAAADGQGSVPPDLLGRLLTQVGRLQREVLAPRALTMSGFSERELQVLRLVADGLETSEIAHRLAYSERTIKNILHDVTSRLQLRSRAQAVAYAVREGLI